ncbi:MAG: DUF4230 domain-containing protein [Phycisphaerales bacterium]
MARLIGFAGCLYLIVLVTLTVVSCGSTDPAPHSEVTHSATQVNVPLIELLREEATLTTLEVDLSTVTTTRIARYYGGVKCCVIIWATATLGSDLEQATVQIIDAERKTLRLTLSDPQLQSLRVDVDRSQIYDVSRFGTWRFAPWATLEGPIVLEAFQRGRRELEKRIDLSHYRRQARSHLEQVVARLAGTLGWEVEVRWAPAPSKV